MEGLAPPNPQIVLIHFYRNLKSHLVTDDKAVQSRLRISLYFTQIPTEVVVLIVNGNEASILKLIEELFCACEVPCKYPLLIPDDCCLNVI